MLKTYAGHVLHHANTEILKISFDGGPKEYDEAIFKLNNFKNDITNIITKIQNKWKKFLNEDGSLNASYTAENDYQKLINKKYKFDLGTPRFPMQIGIETANPWAMRVGYVSGLKKRNIKYEFPYYGEGYSLGSEQSIKFYIESIIDEQIKKLEKHKTKTFFGIGMSYNKKKEKLDQLNELKKECLKYTNTAKGYTSVAKTKIKIDLADWNPVNINPDFTRINKKIQQRNEEILSAIQKHKTRYPDQPAKKINMYDGTTFEDETEALDALIPEASSVNEFQQMLKYMHWEYLFVKLNFTSHKTRVGSANCFKRIIDIDVANEPMTIYEFERNIENAKITARHEVAHIGQCLIDSLLIQQHKKQTRKNKKTPGEVGGFPPKKIRNTSPIDQESLQKNQNPNLTKQQIAHLKNMEFYTYLGDAIDEFKFKTKDIKDKKDKLKLIEYMISLTDYTNLNIKFYESDFFRTLYKYDINKWKKAVKEFVKAVDE